jgi:hypothetical protein
MLERLRSQKIFCDPFVRPKALRHAQYLDFLHYAISLSLLLELIYPYKCERRQLIIFQDFQCNVDDRTYHTTGLYGSKSMIQ